MNMNEKIRNWLLEEDDPGPRYLAMRDLLPETKPAELEKARTEAHQDGMIGYILDKMQPEGWWSKAGPGYSPKYRSTVWALQLLGQLGASLEMDERIRTACDYYIEQALTPNGQFGTNGNPSNTIDCLQGNMCWALSVLGYQSEQLDKAFEWMAMSITGEGIAPKTEKKASIRYYAYQCGSNFACGANKEQSCAWGATKEMLAFSLLPEDKRTPLINRAIQRGVDFFFSIDPVTGEYPHAMAAKPSGNWWKFGFPVFYVTDLLQIAEALTALGYRNDPRLQSTIELIESKRNEQGSWNLEYDYAGKTWRSYGKKKEPNKWVTIRALRVIHL